MCLLIEDCRNEPVPTILCVLLSWVSLRRVTLINGKSRSTIRDFQLYAAHFHSIDGVNRLEIESFASELGCQTDFGTS